ncbi:four-helix bundle copper-binding protein [Streptomyces atratus]
MTTAKDILAACPAELGNIDQDKLARCIEACNICAQACTACADACLSEGMVGDLTKCIRTDMDYADICNATASVLSRHTGYDANVTSALLQACAVACKACGDECASHADMHEHCRLCAEACRACQEACTELLADLSCPPPWRRTRTTGI